MYRKIKGYENYSVSPEGVVLNDKYNRQLSQSITKEGYLVVELWSNNVGKKFSIHRLVAMTFIPNPENKPQVNHKDSDRRNNHIDNLEWATNLENVRAKLIKHSKGKISKRQVVQLYKSKEWKNVEEFFTAIIKT